ncbi:hypothetical protein [Granulibacter bethesdensis]|uniref:hypothetical protein n=1 Tax=Granulibacter bethesdensis TaxID=364410 RepID=UPI0003F1D368|nr:hypothetical protein [Granulibacter bethesdensis]AHJ69317.1 Hypothetical protein GbCGDNIH2_7271 [Granulibacter bethesdensis]
MPKATHTSTTSRRRLLGAGGIIAVASSIPFVASASLHPDAALIAACREYFAVKAEFDAAPTPKDANGQYLFEEEEAQSQEYWRRMDEAIETVISTSPTTSEGLRVKAEFVHLTLPDAASVFSLGADSDQIQAAISLAADILRVLA